MVSAEYNHSLAKATLTVTLSTGLMVKIEGEWFLDTLCVDTFCSVSRCDVSIRGKARSHRFLEENISAKRILCQLQILATMIAIASTVHPFVILRTESFYAEMEAPQNNAGTR
jgi:hypothetical protein